jgi:hypothetical protein
MVIPLHPTCLKLHMSGIFHGCDACGPSSPLTPEPLRLRELQLHQFSRTISFAFARYRLTVRLSKALVERKLMKHNFHGFKLVLFYFLFSESEKPVAQCVFAIARK